MSGASTRLSSQRRMPLSCWRRNACSCDGAAAIVLGESVWPRLCSHVHSEVRIDWRSCDAGFLAPSGRASIVAKFCESTRQLCMPPMSPLGKR